MTFASTEWREFCLSFAPFALATAGAGAFEVDGGKGECRGECGRELLALGFAEDWPLDAADLDADLDNAGEADERLLASSHASTSS